MKKQKLKVGDLLQLNPKTTRNKALAGCFMVVTDPKSFGAMGYIPSIGESGDNGGLAFYRAEWKEFELVGEAEWISG